MLVRRLLLLLFTALLSAAALPGDLRAAAPSTRPVEGLHEHTPGVHALVGARIVTAPGQAIDRGTLVIRDGGIEAVGGEVVVPPDARVWELDGSSIYPGFIDPYSPVSVAEEPAGRGTPYWNGLVQPQRGAARHYRVDKSLNAALRSQGITCRLVVPDSGVIRGTSAVVTTGDAPSEQAVISDRVALHVRLTVDRGSRGSQYPNSPMGAVAMARQAMYDARWHAEAWQAYRTVPGLLRPEQNVALEHLQAYAHGDGLVVFETSDEQDFLRADRFAREFGLHAAIRGSGREYRRLEAIRATGHAVIVPLDFPRPPQVGTPEGALGVPLRDLMHWDFAPENPARLARAGVPMAFTAHGLKSTKDFLAAVRTAVARGLPPETALRALTVEPAALVGLSVRLGTLEAGKAAHLVVTDGDPFEDGARVLETWVEGQRYEVVKSPPVDVRGTWRITAAQGKAKRLVLTLTGKPGKLEGTVRPDRKQAEATKLALVGLRGARLACTFPGKAFGAPGTAQLSATVTSAPDDQLQWLGSIHWPDGTTTAIEGQRLDEQPSDQEEAKDGEEDEAEEEPTPPTKAAASFAVNFPLGAYGRDGPPEQPPLVAFRGGTVWTCGKRGIVEDATVIVGSGRVLAVGADLDVPDDAMVVDCSGKHVTPGIIDAHSHMATDGGVNESGQAISAEVRIADFLDAEDIDIYRQLAAGVTVSHVLHGSSNPIGGQNQVIKLRWGGLPDELVFAEAPPTIKFALGENVKQSNRGENYTTRYPQTRMGVEQIIRDALHAAETYRRRRDEWRRTRRGLPPRRDLEMDALVEVLEHRSWIHCHAYRQDEVLALLRVLEEFGLKAGALHHILEGYKVADVMARHGAAGSAFSDWWAYKFEVYDAIPHNGALMHRAGVLVSFNSDSAELARRLNTEAAKAVKYGRVPPEQALEFVTLNAAKQLRVEEHVGSLEPGKHADLVVWSGPPLSTFSRPEQTWIDGRRYFDLEEDRNLRSDAERRRTVLVQKILAPHEQEEDAKKKDGSG